MKLVEIHWLFTIVVINMDISRYFSWLQLLCTFCGIRGHKEAYCRKKQAANRGRRGNSSQHGGHGEHFQAIATSSVVSYEAQQSVAPPFTITQIQQLMVLLPDNKTNNSSTPFDGKINSKILSTFSHLSSPWYFYSHHLGIFIQGAINISFVLKFYQIVHKCSSISQYRMVLLVLFVALKLWVFQINSNYILFYISLNSNWI